jgi:hypothetical protein
VELFCDGARRAPEGALGLEMAGNPRARFSLRFFLAFWLVIGLLCAVGAYLLAIALFVIALLHFVLLLVGSAFADHFPAGRSPILRRGFAWPGHDNNGPVVLVICYLVFFCCWRVTAFFMFTPLGVQRFWCTPFEFGLSISSIEHCLLILFHVYLYASFVGDCYGTGHVSPSNCGGTACLSVLLLASHFAIPRG